MNVGNWTVGAEVPSRSAAPIGITDVVRYQGAAGDFNPLHHDLDYARHAGYPRLLSVGMLQASVLGSYVADVFGPDQIRSFGAQFVAPAFVGDELTYHAAITEIAQDAEARTASLELRAVLGSGAVHINGHATVVLP